VSALLFALAASVVSLASTGELPGWVLRSPYPTGQNLQAVTSGPSGFVAVGEGGIILRSTHGAVWEQISSPALFGLYQVWFQDGEYVATGHYDLLVSSDGASWQATPSPTLPGGAQKVMTHAERRLGKWFVAGSDGVHVSKAGGGWDAWPFTGYVGPTGMATDGDRVVVVPANASAVLVARGASGWTRIEVPGVGFVHDVRWHGGTFVLNGRDSLATSTDGETWTLRATPAVGGIGKVLRRYDSGWVMTDGSTRFQHSPDLTTWTTRTCNIPLVCVARNSATGAWVAVGYTGAVSTSTDAVTWTRRDFGATDTLRAVAYFGGKLIAVGDNAGTAYFDDGISVRTGSTIPGAGLLIRLQVVGDRIYALDSQGLVFSSANGTTWRSETSWPGRAGFDFSSVPSTYTPIGDPVWTGERWLQVMGTGIVGAGAVFASTDGRNWDRVLATGLPLLAVYAQPGLCLAAGSGLDIYRSTDGLTWEAIQVSSGSLLGIASLAGGDGWIVAPLYSLPGGALVSRDGRSWERLPSLTASLHGATYHDGSFWLAGEGGSLVEIPVRQSAPIANLSARFTMQPGGLPVIAGFVVEGGQAGNVLVRAVGATLRDYGVPSVVTAPTLKLYAGPQLAAQAGDWEASPAKSLLASEAQRLGAFPLAVNSHDAALLPSVGRGSYTAVVEGTRTTAADVLVEIYDARQAGQTAENMRLVNSSARGAALRQNPLIGGFYVSGERSRRVLVRAAGPALTAYGVASAAVDPLLAVFSGPRVVAENDDWGQAGADALATADAAAAAGAFPFATGSRDAALVFVAAPGAYTVHVAPAKSSVGGEVLFEVYYLD
jgi:hypothetical protein